MSEKPKKTPEPQPDETPTLTGWAKALADARAAGKAIEPFEITTELVLQPPTPTRARAMSTATLEVQAAVVAAFHAVQNGADTDTITATQQRIEAAELAYTTALVGEDKFEAVQAFLADLDEWQRQALLEAVKDQFQKHEPARPPATPAP